MGLLDRRYGGKLTNALTGTTNKFGDARSTLPQALWSGVGMNAYSVDPEHSQIQNIQQYMAKISDAERSLKTRLADRGLSDAERAEVMADYTKRVRELGAELLEYRKGSEVPEPLKARR